MGDGDFFDRFGHIGDGDFLKTLGGFLWALSQFACEGCKFSGDDDGVDGLRGTQPEDMREKFGTDAACHHVGVGDGEGSAFAIASRPRIGARTFGAHAHAGVFEEQNRSATGGDGVNGEHGCANADTADFVFEDAFIVTIEARDIGGGAAHIEANDFGEACGACGFGHADDATGRP